MATAEQLKSLIRSHASGDNDRFRSVAMQIAAHSARAGKGQLAKELRDLIDAVVEGPRLVVPTGPRAVPIARPPGELAGLVTASYPATRLTDMVLDASVAARLQEIVLEYHARDRLRSHGLSPQRKLLLVGPPGCGKTMTAAALAGECGLPLMFVQLHGLITKFMGETAAKLHSLFEAMSLTRGVYLFDEFDAIGSSRDAGNDVGEIRRVLNSFLQLIERDDSDSLIVAATNFVGMLDEALFRRFDDVVRYERPDAGMTVRLVRNRLAAFDTSQVDWLRVPQAAAGLSHAEVVRACEAAAKVAVLADSTVITHALLEAGLEARQLIRGSRERGTTADVRSSAPAVGRAEQHPI